MADTLAVPAAPTNATVLFVGNSPDIAALAVALPRESWAVDVVPDRRSADAHLAANACDVLVSAVALSEDAVRWLRRLRRARPFLKVIVLADTADPATTLAALREHAFSCFSRPVAQDQFKEMLEFALSAPRWDDGITLLSDKPDWVSIRAKCRRLTAERLVHFVDELSADLGDEERASMSTAFREILMNAMEHGGGFDPELEVEITRLRTSRLVMYVVRDPGEGFDFTDLAHAAVTNPDDPVAHLEQREADGLRAGGFGLLIARGLVDELLHNAKGNETVLIKYVR